ncbi:MAG TPA: DegT/DnrJ/EryC1/StrS family aminotransferase [Stellaceae bacterium]|jgi:dTDP-4-amino-4,6-dideoxygalactose transaminase|nr:DegT/DnrJ/EryC1/StrS family aminotransferase [Stellaceae bacterium]
MKSLRFDLPATPASRAQTESLRIPFLRPNPPKLSLQSGALAEIERSGVFSNYGPVNSRLEERVSRALFRAENRCVTTANATLGLMLAIKQAVGWNPRGRYALMPSFTFAAGAQAALWCGLTPLFCDVDSDTWLPSAEAEAELLAQYGSDIAVMVPNATFGNCLDLARYHEISTTRGIPLVVDAAAALGSLDADGRPFGIGCEHPLVFSLHATKAFATAEGGLVYCADPQIAANIRAMGNFGFGEPRNATMPGLNSKMSEVCALLGLSKLSDYEAVARHRQALFEKYCALLPEFIFQKMTGQRTAHQFVSVLVPQSHSGNVEGVIEVLRSKGIGAARYFVPHLAEQPFFQQTCVAGALPVTEKLARRIIALPAYDTLTEGEVDEICRAFREACAPQPRIPAPRSRAVKQRYLREINREHLF